jgi:hypothetical protein
MCHDGFHSKVRRCMWEALLLNNGKEITVDIPGCGKLTLKANSLQTIRLAGGK